VFRSQDEWKNQILEGRAVTSKSYIEVEDLEVYKKLCQLHIEVCNLTHSWPLKRSTSWEAIQGVRQTAHLLNSLRKMMIGISVTKLKA